jgi:hypothetical protein
MERKEQEPFDREAWRRLLGSDAGAPTKEIDRRILAEARRALAPRIARWWLPVSLAASLLLAVLIVQWQLADVGKPAAVTETDVPATPATAASQDREVPMELPNPAQRQQDSAKASAPVPVPVPRMDLPPMEPSIAPVEAMPASAVPAPAPAGKPAVEMHEERAQKQADTESTGMLGSLTAKESHAESRTPEKWYADIQALRAAGHVQQADAELTRFKSRYPDWLEQHHQKDP